MALLLLLRRVASGLLIAAPGPSVSAPTSCCCCFSCLSLLPHPAAAASPLSPCSHILLLLPLSLCLSLLAEQREMLRRRLQVHVKEDVKEQREMSRRLPERASKAERQRERKQTCGPAGGGLRAPTQGQRQKRSVTRRAERSRRRPGPRSPSQSASLS